MERLVYLNNLIRWGISFVILQIFIVLELLKFNCETTSWKAIILFNNIILLVEVGVSFC